MAGGQPTKYNKKYNDQVFKLCLLGAKDKQLADFFNVCEKTINNWKKAEPEFLQSLKKGKDEADMAIASSLYDRAKGFTYTTQKAFKCRTGSGADLKEEVVVIDIDEYIPPDATSIIFWLKNRNPDQWRENKDNDNPTPVVITVNNIKSED